MLTSEEKGNVGAGDQMKPLRVLYSTEDCFPPFRADVVELFAKQFRANGHTVDWLMQRGEESKNLKSPVDWAGNSVHLTPGVTSKTLWGRLLNNVLAMVGDLMIVRMAINGHYDVIQVRDRPFSGLIAWFASRLTSAKFVFWMSYPFAESKLYQARQRLVRHHHLVWLKGHAMRIFLYRVVLPLADHVFVQSEQMKADVENEGIPGSRLTAVPMGIRADQVGAPEDAKELNTHAPQLLYLGIILRLRQTEMLVDVLAQIKKRYPRACLIYVGDGQAPGDRAAVEERAKLLGLTESVKITGFLPMEKAWEYVKSADICFSPFCPIPVLLSTSPTKLVEYLAMAKCVVANEHPEQSVILAESGAGSSVPWSVDAFAKEALNLLDNPDVARQQASRGPQWVRKNRTYDEIVKKVIGAYNMLFLKDSRLSGVPDASEID